MRPEGDLGEVWIVPVAEMLAHWDPFRAWTLEPVLLDEVAEALREDRLDERPYDTVSLLQLPSALRRYHAERIAWLVVHPDDTPVEIDVGAPSLGWHPRSEPFDFLDGNHRLCAAAYRGDEAILVSYGGECDAMPAIFPRGRPLPPLDDF
jgi:hypothetical protein